MNKRILWSRILCIMGLAITAIVLVAFGVNWQIGGFGWLSTVLLLAVFVLPVPVSALAALGAFLGKSHYRRFMYCALALTLCGSIVLFLLMGNFEAPTVPWWEFVVVAYPVGAIMSLVGAVVVIVESFHRARVSQGSTGTA